MAETQYIWPIVGAKPGSGVTNPYGTVDRLGPYTVHELAAA